MKIEIEIGKINEENKGEARIKNEKWMHNYNYYYEMIFANMTNNVKMDGFRKGAIPSILLELKYPSIVSETNERSMFAVIQNIHAELKKDHPNIKLDNYFLDEQTKDLIISFHLEVGEKDNEKNNGDSRATAENHEVKNKKTGKNKKTTAAPEDKKTTTKGKK